MESGLVSIKILGDKLIIIININTVYKRKISVAAGRSVHRFVLRRVFDSTIRGQSLMTTQIIHERYYNLFWKSKTLSSASNKILRNEIKFHQRQRQRRHFLPSRVTLQESDLAASDWRDGDPATFNSEHSVGSI